MNLVRDLNNSFEVLLTNRVLIEVNVGGSIQVLITPEWAPKVFLQQWKLEKLHYYDLETFLM